MEALLTAAEETELAHQIEAGLLAREARLTGRGGQDATEQELRLVEELGEQARQRFIQANLRLVAKIARQAAVRSTLPENDLFQEGCLGLISAVERFDWRLGYKFSTYASFWVRAYVGVATASLLGALNLPNGRAHQLRMARGVEVELTQFHGRPASMAEVAANLGRSEKWTAGLMAHQVPQSFDGLDVGTLEPPAHSWGEPGPSDDGQGAELLCHLEGLDRDVLSLRYGFTDGTAHTFPEIAGKLEITVSKARRLEGRALEKLRSVCPSRAALWL